jgi:catechol 2,3-dioxygenase-like lactoylglutathione lyase family enzyme
MQLDHVIIAVSDLDQAAARYEAILGRPPALRGEHPAYGTANVLFIFEQGPYLELLAAQPDADGVYATLLRRFLDQHGEGLYGVALAPDDLDQSVSANTASTWMTHDTEVAWTPTAARANGARRASRPPRFMIHSRC